MVWHNNNYLYLFGIQDLVILKVPFDPTWCLWCARWGWGCRGGRPARDPLLAASTRPSSLWCCSSTRPDIKKSRWESGKTDCCIFFVDDVLFVDVVSVVNVAFVPFKYFKRFTILTHFNNVKLYAIDKTVGKWDLTSHEMRIKRERERVRESVR